MIKYGNAWICWSAETKEIEVYDEGDFDLDSDGGFGEGWNYIGPATGDSETLLLMAFHRMVIGDGLDAERVHRELLNIKEYAEGVPYWDGPSADEVDEEHFHKKREKQSAEKSSNQTRRAYPHTQRDRYPRE